MAFTVNARGDATAVTLRPGEPRERLAPRVAPLPGTRHPTPDPDASLTIRITAALEAIRHGGAALSAAADVTPGAKQDFSRGADPALAEMSRATYIGQEDVSGRGIRRHGSEVARVRLYRLPPGERQRYVLVHLTAAGSVTDYDVVDR